MTVSVLRRPVFKYFAMALLLALAGCTTPGPRGGAGPSPHYKIGKPYKINGRWYRPAHDPDYNRIGTASWYGRDFHGRKTANGEIYDMNEMTAAHTTLPMPSMVEVKNLENGRKVVVRVNDRGPFAHDRIIDMSRAAARRLGFEKNGLARVRVRYLGPAGHGDRRHEAPAIVSPANRAAPARNSDVPPEPAGDGIEELLEAIEAQPAPPSGADEVALNETPAEAARSYDYTAEPALYMIRVVTLSHLDNIEAVRASLAPIGPLRLTRVKTGEGGYFYRINMGPFSDLNEASQRLEAVSEAGYGDASLAAVAP